MKAPVWILIIGGVAWIALAGAFAQHSSLPSTAGTWLTEFAWAGDVLAPAGAIATIAALWHAFDVQRKTQDERHRDELGSAYVRWLKEARALMSDLKIRTSEHLQTLRVLATQDNAVYQNGQQVRNQLASMRSSSSAQPRSFFSKTIRRWWA